MQAIDLNFVLSAIALFLLIAGLGELFTACDGFRRQFSPAAQRAREAEFLLGLLGEAGQGGESPHGDRFTRARGVASPVVVGTLEQSPPTFPSPAKPLFDVAAEVNLRG